MRSAAEYRAYAEQCVDWAKAARTGDERDALVDMARTWLDAAQAADESRVTRATSRRP
jgi:hypothetical protein